MCADNRNGECPMHGPLHSLRRLVGTSSASTAVPPPEVPEWLRDLPREVCLCTSTVPGLGYGICAAQRIPQGTWIGPFQGIPLLLDKVHSGVARNTRHLWEVSIIFLKFSHFWEILLTLNWQEPKPFQNYTNSLTFKKKTRHDLYGWKAFMYKIIWNE